MFKQTVKSLALHLLGRYRLNWIYRVDLSSHFCGDAGNFDIRRMQSGEAMRRAADPLIQAHAYFADGAADAFGLWNENTLACTCVIWEPARYLETTIGSVLDDEAVLVDVVTAASHRQRGYAYATIQHAMAEMAQKGRRSLVCTIWHNNRASIKSFEKAGWRRTAFVAEFFPLGKHIAFRLPGFRWRRLPRR
ncbi:MAG: GNAT family N-acetyltransferase [Betaproteobacteria bacterium]|nr:GNAT family N-acetyltransferase [Betaproteobacteria bacterium]